MEISGRIEDFQRASACAIKHGLLVADNNGPIPIVASPDTDPAIVVSEDRIAIVAFGNLTVYRWIECLGRWQNVTRLLANYGKEPATPDFLEVTDRLQLNNFQPTCVIETPFYKIELEKANSTLFLHSTITSWNREIKQMFFNSVNQLQHDVPLDSYIYSIKPNEEYGVSSDTTLKFAQMIGYHFYETVVLSDGFEHDIYKRDKQTIL